MPAIYTNVLLGVLIGIVAPTLSLADELGGSAEKREKARQLCVAAFQAGSRKEYRRMIDLCTQALELDRNNATALQFRGEGHYASGEYELAIADYTEILRLRPQNSWAYGNRSRAYEAVAEDKKAVSDALQWCRLNGRFPSFFRKDGRLEKAVAAKGDPALSIDEVSCEVIRLATHELKNDPRNVKCYLDRASAHLLKEQYDLALVDYEVAVRLAPKSAEAYACRGNARFARGEYEEAIGDFTNAIGLDANHDWGFLFFQFRAKAYLAKGDTAKATGDLAQSVRYSLFKNAASYVRRGRIYMGKGECDRAISDASEAIRLEPSLASAYRLRGDAYRALGNSDKTAVDEAKAKELEKKLGGEKGK